MRLTLAIHMFTLQLQAQMEISPNEISLKLQGSENSTLSKITTLNVEFFSVSSVDLGKDNA